MKWFLSYLILYINVGNNEKLCKNIALNLQAHMFWKYPKHMFYEEIRMKQGLLFILFCPIRILYNSIFILMATALGTNAVVVMRVHCSKQEVTNVISLVQKWHQTYQMYPTPLMLTLCIFIDIRREFKFCVTYTENRLYTDTDTRYNDKICYTVNQRYNDSICFQRCCHLNKFAVVQNI